MKTIKTLCITLLTIFIFSNAVCNKKIKFEKLIDGASTTFIAQPQAAGPYNFSETVKFNLEEQLKPYDVSLTQVTKVVVESVTIAIEDTTVAPVTFNIVDFVNLELGSSSIANVQVAFKNPVPHTGLSVISPDLAPEYDVLPLAKGNDLTYHFTGNLNAALTHQIKMKVTIKWKITAEL